jgi:hypothetical protein
VLHQPLLTGNVHIALLQEYGHQNCDIKMKRSGSNRIPRKIGGDNEEDAERHGASPTQTGQLFERAELGMSKCEL